MKGDAPQRDLLLAVVSRARELAMSCQRRPASLTTPRGTFLYLADAKWSVDSVFLALAVIDLIEEVSAQWRRE